MKQPAQPVTKQPQPAPSTKGLALGNPFQLLKQQPAGNPLQLLQQPRQTNPMQLLQAAPVQLQKKIGFEMEDATWNSWIKTWGIRDPKWISHQNNVNCRPMDKKELLHQGTDFKLEADKFAGDDGLVSDIEFVTTPLPLDAGGFGRLMRVMEQIDTIYNKIIPLRGRDHKKGEFIKNAESGFSQTSAMLSKGNSGAMLNLQATHGLSLQDIPTAFEALSKTPAEAENQAAYSSIQYGAVGLKNASTEATLEPLRSASDRALRISLMYIADHAAAESEYGDEELPEEDFAALHGFITAAIGFIRMLRNPLMLQGGIKTFLPMMHRNDFATMFGMLPDKMRRTMQANEEVFTDAIIAGATADLTEDDPLADYAPDDHADEYVFNKFILQQTDRTGFTNVPTVPNLPNTIGTHRIAYYVTPPLTIARWVNSWMNNRNPVDILTKEAFAGAATNVVDPDAALSVDITNVKANMDPAISRLIDWGRCKKEGGIVYLAFNYTALDAQQKATINNYSRGLGGLKDQTDTDDPSLLLYENRSIAPEYRDVRGQKLDLDGSKLSLGSATEAVLSYFSGMMKLFSK